MAKESPSLALRTKSLKDATVQEIQLELVLRSRIGDFCGERLIRVLLENPALWEGVICDMLGVNEGGHRLQPASMIKLRDIGDNDWNDVVGLDVNFASPDMPASQFIADSSPGGEYAARFRERLREIDLFFQGNDRVHQTMRRVADKLESANIPYAIVGGMAVNAHGHERTTKDVDFLLTAEGMAAFFRSFVAHDFDPVPGRPRRFIDRANGVSFGILVSGLFPGNGKLGPVVFPNPVDVGQPMGDLRVVDLATLVQLKLAAHRYQDFADVVNLIRSNGLDEGFQERLHASVCGDFIECLEEKRREDEYEARQDQSFEDKRRESGGHSPGP